MHTWRRAVLVQVPNGLAVIITQGQVFQSSEQCLYKPIIFFFHAGTCGTMQKSPHQLYTSKLQDLMHLNWWQKIHWTDGKKFKHMCRTVCCCSPSLSPIALGCSCLLWRLVRWTQRKRWRERETGVCVLWCGVLLWCVCVECCGVWCGVLLLWCVLWCGVLLWCGVVVVLCVCCVVVWSVVVVFVCVCVRESEREL